MAVQPFTSGKVGPHEVVLIVADGDFSPESQEQDQVAKREQVADVECKVQGSLAGKWSKMPGV